MLDARAIKKNSFFYKSSSIASLHPFLVTLHISSLVYKEEMDFGSYNGAIKKHCMGFQEKNKV